MPKAAHFPTRQAAADNAVAYSVHMGWGCSGYRVRTAHIPNGPYLAMAKHKDGRWAHVDWCAPSMLGLLQNPTALDQTGEREPYLLLPQQAAWVAEAWPMDGNILQIVEATKE